MAFWTALEFLTILPTPGQRQRETEPGRTLPYFPLVGLLLGLILLGLHYGLSQVLPQPVIAGLLVITLAVLTGGHHLDGLIDTFNGLGGTSKEARLQIMVQNGSSPAGMVSALLLLLTKYLALSQAAMLPALLLAPTLARGALVSVVFAFPAARSYGLGYDLKQGTGKLRLAVATIIPLAVAVLMLDLKGLILAAALWPLIWGISYYLRSKLGGLTGDSYGALVEIAEVLVLILIVWLL